MPIVLLGGILALGAAFCESVVDVLRKKRSTEFDAVTAAWSLHAAVFLVLAPSICTMLVTDTSLLGNAAMVPRSWEFWRAIGASLIPNIAATYLYMRALSTMDISIAVPLVTLTSPFLLVTALVINGEVPSGLGVAGILISVAGTYLLKYDGSGGWYAPLARLFKEPASRMMLGVAFLYSISSPWDKRAVISGGTLWTTWFLHGSLALIYTPLLSQKGRWRRLWEAPHSLWWFILFGLVGTARNLCQFTALRFLLTPYVIGLKRSSVIFGVLWGRWYFREPQTGQRAVAATVMLIGSLLILLASL